MITVSFWLAGSILAIIGLAGFIFGVAFGRRQGETQVRQYREQVMTRFSQELAKWEAAKPVNPREWPFRE